jgi:hypothetical protein
LTTAGFSGTWYNTNQDLKAANRAVLNEANFSQSLKHEIDRLRQELKVKQESWTVANQELRKALNRVQEELRQSTIVGRVYADANYNQALDWRDHEVTGNISGFEVVLYTTEKRSDGSLNTIEVASTNVTNGEYRFIVGPGEYFVGVTYSENQLYSRRYNHIIHINGGNMIIGNGEIVIGPTILLADNGLG